MLSKNRCPSGSFSMGSAESSVQCVSHPGESRMDPSPDDSTEPIEKLPLGQRLFDNMYLLLALGLLVMFVVFTGWGMWEILSMPQSTLP